MDLRELVEAVLEQTEGALAAGLFGLDGLPVEVVRREGFEVDPEHLAMELAGLLQGARRSAQVWGDGATPEEAFFGTPERLLLCQQVTPEYFAGLLLENPGNLGRARFQMRWFARQLAALLEG